MLNMNSPVVQNLMPLQSGFNPYTNNGYIPQQQQQNYYGYNPYVLNQQNKDILDEWEFTYDPMPDVVINQNRGIHTGVVQRGGGPIQTINNQYDYNGYNNNIAFNGYMNPILMKNQMEAEKLRLREEAINQGKIWKRLLKSESIINENFNIDEEIRRIESLYYTEPVTNNIPIKDKIILEKNNYFGELESRLDYYKQNNIPIIDNNYIMNMKLANYYNHINEIIGNTDECDIVDYFTRVYPELRHEELSWLCERQKRNLKNKYNSGEFNKLIDKVSEDRPDSYYYKLMETFSEDGVKLSNGDGLTITPDEMEIKLPNRLLKNKQDVYYEQRKKFFDSIFNKER